MPTQNINKSVNQNLSQDSSVEKPDLKEDLRKSEEEKTKLSDKIASLEKAQDIIFEQFRDLELQRLNIEKEQKRLKDTSHKFRKRSIDLFGKMVDLKNAKKIISLQNKKLKNQQKEIQKQQLLLEKSNHKFRERTIELFGKVTDLKKAKKIISLQKEEIEKHREQLRESNASKDKFFSIIAHDLRNPMAGFLNLTEVLSNNFDVFSETESKEFIDVMNQSSKQLYNLLENLLQWSRSQTGSINFEPKFVPVRNMVDTAIDMLTTNIENKKLYIDIQVEKKIVAYADENMISAVIRNLISNGIKFSQPNESITIKCTPKDNFIEFAVIDKGIGITREDQDKLFRIDEHHTTQGTSEEKGTGLGLILCKEFIVKNGGKIWVESEVNKGSSFIFTLPKQAYNQ